MGEGAILVEDLVVGRGGKAVLHGISLMVRPGEITALVGANGAGKSTLVMTLAGLLPALRGKASFAGRALLGQTSDRIRRAGIAVVPEGHQVLSELSVHDNLRAAGSMHSRVRLEDEIEAALAMFPELKARLDVPGKALSGGQKQMLALSQAVIARPRMLLIDELSLGLAPTVVKRLAATLPAFAKNVGVLLIEQFTSLALSLASEAYVLERGRIVFSGRAAELAEARDFAQRLSRGKHGLVPLGEFLKSGFLALIDRSAPELARRASETLPEGAREMRARVEAMGKGDLGNRLLRALLRREAVAAAIKTRIPEEALWTRIVGLEGAVDIAARTAHQTGNRIDRQRGIAAMGRDVRLDTPAQELERRILDLAPGFTRADEADREVSQRLADAGPRDRVERRRFLHARACESRDDLRQPLRVAAEQMRPRQQGESAAGKQLPRQLQDDLLDAGRVEDEIGTGRVIDDPGAGRQQRLEAVVLPKTRRSRDLQQELDRVDPMAAVADMLAEHVMRRGVDTADAARSKAARCEGGPPRFLAHKTLPDIAEQAPGNAAEGDMVARDKIGCGKGSHMRSERFPLQLPEA